MNLIIKVDLSKLNYYVISEIKDGKTCLDQESANVLKTTVSFLENKLNVKVKPFYLDDFKDIYPVFMIILIFYE